MKIAIDLTSLSYHITGIERYALCVSEKMIMLDSENEYILIFRNEVYPVFKKLVDNARVKAVILTGNNKLLFYQIVLPFNLYRIRADRYLFFAFTSPILFRRSGIINTIHDMGPWDASEALKFLQKVYLKTTCFFSAKASKKIITVSQFSKNRISEILNISSDLINVIPSAVYEGVLKGHAGSFNEVKGKYGIPDTYIMTLSTLEPRKNMEMLLRAFDEIQDRVGYDLVLVGRKGWKMDEVIEKYNKKNRIHITGFVSDEDVSLIYKNAMCFVFPSLYEGFGLPPVEALALGTPVLSSDAASLPEVLREQATYFINRDIDDLKRKLSQLEIDVKEMPRCLDEYQKQTYSFDTAAMKVLAIL